MAFLIEYRSPEKFCPIAALGDVVQNFSGKLYDGKKPQIGKDVFLAPTAVLIGDVRVGDNSSIWFRHTLPDPTALVWDFPHKSTNGCG